MKNKIFPHTFWRPFLDCMPQLFFRPKYVWFPIHLKGPMIPDPSGQLAELIVYITSTRVDLYSHQILLDRHATQKDVLSDKTPHTCGAINLRKWDSLSHPQSFVTTCSHHSNLTEMNLTQNIPYIFKHFMYRTKNIRNQNHCYVHKFTDYTHYEECNWEKETKDINKEQT